MASTRSAAVPVAPAHVGLGASVVWYTAPPADAAAAAAARGAEPPAAPLHPALALLPPGASFPPSSYAALAASSSASSPSASASSASSFSGTRVFFDSLHQEVILLRGSPPTEAFLSHRPTGRWRRFPLSFPDDPYILDAQISHDYSLLALRTSDKDVRIHDLSPVGKGAMVESRSCRGSLSSMLAVHWLPPTTHAATATAAAAQQQACASVALSAAAALPPGHPLSAAAAAIARHTANGALQPSNLSLTHAGAVAGGGSAGGSDPALADPFAVPLPALTVVPEHSDPSAVPGSLYQSQAASSSSAADAAASAAQSDSESAGEGRDAMYGVAAAIARTYARHQARLQRSRLRAAAAAAEAAVAAATAAGLPPPALAATAAPDASEADRKSGV